MINEHVARWYARTGEVMRQAGADEYTNTGAVQIAALGQCRSVEKTSLFRSWNVRRHRRSEARDEANGGFEPSNEPRSRMGPGSDIEWPRRRVVRCRPRGLLSFVSRRQSSMAMCSSSIADVADDSCATSSKSSLSIEESSSSLLQLLLSVSE